ncbi:hypothetical protein VaNZ11_012083 [Volvox africanus]|uniref:tRNA-intron lyase n=1 Tax=Volvox africanus TaxID=51714 RepID=A0ABQ5SDS1_9CHLO|nr:hypothetical protein VaNZ11_012083 [Volvox africanus]
MGQLKRRRPKRLLRPDEMLATLASLRLHALLQHGGIWLAVLPELSELLNQCCTGQMDGGPGTAEEVAAVLAPLVGEVHRPAGIRHAVSNAATAADSATSIANGGEDPEALQEQRSDPGADAGGAASGLQAMEVDAVPLEQQQQQQSGFEAAAGRDPGIGQGKHSGAGREAAVIIDAAITQIQSKGIERRDIMPSAVERSNAAGDPGDASPEHRPSFVTPLEALEGNGADAVALDAVDVLRKAGRQQADAGAVGLGGRQGATRGRGRRGGGGGYPPYSPAAEGCQLVAVRLTLEEAFFMHYVLRCLEVYELQPGSPIPATVKNVRLLDTEELWRACRATRSNFVTSYAAYHHLKSKGWIPRSGLLYGVDFVVYQLHPMGAHSEFGVLVMPLGSGPGGGSGSGGPHAPQLSWLDLQITNRLINQVVKKLVLLYLSERPGTDHATPHCLERFAVEERLVRRWVPDATRD